MNDSWDSQVEDHNEEVMNIAEELHNLEEVHNAEEHHILEEEHNEVEHRNLMVEDIAEELHIR